MKFGVITGTWQALIKVLVWGVILQSWRTEDEQLWSCMAVLVCAQPHQCDLWSSALWSPGCDFFMCCPPAVSLGQIHPQQSWGNWWNCINNLLDFICSELLAWHALCSVPSFCWAQVIGTCLCSSQPVSAWSCCCKSLCAAGAEPLLHRERPCLCWESRMWGKTCGRQQKQQMMGRKVRGSEGWQKKKDRNNIFTICFEYILRLEMMNFNECIPPSSLGSSWQAGSGLVLQVQRKHTPLGQWWGWRLVKIVPLPAIHTWDKWEPLCMSGPPGCNHNAPFQLLQGHPLSALQGPVTQPEEKSSTSPLHAWTRLLVRTPHDFSDAACCPNDVWRKFFTSLILETAPLSMARADWSLIPQIHGCGQY